MPREYPNEFGAVALVWSGQRITKMAAALGITDSCLKLVKQDHLDRGEIEGVSRAESRELREIEPRIPGLEKEVEILRSANALLSSLAHLSVQGLP